MLNGTSSAAFYFESGASVESRQRFERKQRKDYCGAEVKEGEKVGRVRKKREKREGS